MSFLNQFSFIYFNVTIILVASKILFILLCFRELNLSSFCSDLQLQGLQVFPSAYPSSHIDPLAYPAPLSEAVRPHSIFATWESTFRRIAIERTSGKNTRDP